MSDELILDSLRRRFRALFSLYEDATATMTIEQVNHREKDLVMPIAFSLFHWVNMIDASMMLLTGEPFICNDEILEAINLEVPDHGKHRTVEEMHVQQIGNYEAFIDYMNKVFARIEKYLAELQPEELTRLVIPRHRLPIPSLLGWRVQKASLCSTASSAGCISTVCATWERSSWLAPSWACKA
jgi:hypothetical protein